MINPYASTGITIETPPVTGRNEASLIWFAGPLTALLIAQDGYYSRFDLNQMGAINLAFESIRGASPFVIPAVLVFAAARYVFRMRFDYSSTRLSSIAVGIIAYGYLAWLIYLDWYNISDDQVVWSVGTLAGLLIGLGLSALERRIAAASSQDSDDASPAGSIRTQPNHASIFWFSGTVCLVMCVFGALTEGGIEISVMAEIASTMCVIFTGAYGLVSACFIRRHPATHVSRIGAAAVYTGLLILITLPIRNPNLFIIPVAFFAPAIFAVAADRLIARKSARA